MHLKNFSLIKLPGIGMTFSPAYDLVATALVNPDDKEELALTLNAKKRKIKKTDFITAFNTLKLDEKQQINIFNKMIKSQQAWMDRIKISFLSQDLKDKYIRLIAERIQTIL
jgi:serine/threonine-protein kinase HipA